MQAFGPYPDKVVIDFEEKKINEGPLLLTGDTGAGKTAIFDAICFALFGSSSGGSRKDDALRSDYADDSIKTYVELEFYYNSKLYTIKRCPGYERARKDGKKGTTKENPSVEFEKDGISYTKIPNANKAIIELLGVNDNQFKQIVMLAQGEFTKLIEAKVSDTTMLFRQIFNTDIYGIVMEQLKNQNSKLDNEYDNTNKLINAERDRLDEKYASFDDKALLEELEKDIKIDDEELKETFKKKEEANALWQSLNTQLTNQNDINTKLTDLAGKKKELQELKNNHPNIDNDRIRRNYNRDVAKDIFNILDNIDKNNSAIENNNKRITELNKLLSDIKNTLENRKEEFKIIDTYNEENQKLNDLLNDNKNYLNDLNNAKDTKDEIVSNKELYDKEKEKYENAEKQLSQLQDAYYFDICSNIASELKDNEPCPVCGSTHHPNIAKNHGEVVSKEMVETKQKEVNELLRQYTDYETKRNEAIKQLEKSNMVKVDLPLEISKCIEKKNNLEKQINDLKNTYITLKAEHDKFNSDLTKYITELKGKEENNTTLSDTVKADKTKLDKIYSDNNTNYEHYKQLYLSDIEYKKLDKDVSDFDSKHDEYVTTINTLSELVEGKSFVDTKQLKIDCDNAEKQFKDLDLKYNDFNVKLSGIKDIKVRIKKAYDSNVALLEQLKIMNKLSGVANGDGATEYLIKPKMTFENYIQSYYLDFVLAEANNKLLQMSDSRYELIKKIEPDTKKEKLGIAFVVYDAYSESERRINDLSGGEKFKVALSLALGISDFISMNAGGIKMDSLFVDEGFGSLDKDSLDKAVKVLRDISVNGKLVGIISHVKDLADAIDKQIVVKKQRKGSSVEIIA